tara:strand:+ start:400 stop:717 length:318 start_codon:yes stop_codon:yes gene_type:complete
MKFREYPKKFKDRVTSAGRQYSRWGVTGTFSTTDDAVNKYKNDFYVAPGDVVRWHSNNRIPFGDMLLDFCEALLITPKQLRVSNEIREEETDKFWKDHFSLTGEE